MSDAHSLDTLIQALRRLPGVGVKSAQRMAFHLLQRDRPGAQALARALIEATENVHHCERCHTFTQDPMCATCLDTRRDHTQLCVVETPADQAALERTGAYRGLYFVLMVTPWCCCTASSRKSKRHRGRNWIWRRIDSNN